MTAPLPAQWPQGMPAGACDTHMHVYDRAVAAAPGGPQLPGDYSVLPTTAAVPVVDLLHGG